MTRDAKKELGDWLATLRKESPFDSQQAVANEMNRRFGSKVSSTKMSEYERGEHAPDGARVWELLDVYGVKYDRQPPVETPEIQQRLATIEAKLDSITALILGDVDEFEARSRITAAQRRAEQGQERRDETA